MAGQWSRARQAASTASGARGTPSSESRSLWAPAQQGGLARAPATLSFFCQLPGAWPRPARTHCVPSCPGAKTQCKGRAGETRVCKGEGRNDPTLPHPRLESRNNSKTGERQSSKQHSTAPARGSQPAWGLGEKELTAGAEQGWVSWSLRQQRLLCCTTWLGLLRSQLT